MYPFWSIYFTSRHISSMWTQTIADLCPVPILPMTFPIGSTETSRSLFFNSPTTASITLSSNPLPPGISTSFLKISIILFPLFNSICYLTTYTSGVHRIKKNEILVSHTSILPCLPTGRHDFIIPLFGLRREFGSRPLFPSSLECINFIIPFVNKFLCHTGTCSFVGSGTIEDKDFLLGVLVHPGLHFLRVFPYSSFDLDVAPLPIRLSAHVHNDQIRFIHLLLEFLLGDPGNVVCPCGKGENET